MNELTRVLVSAFGIVARVASTMATDLAAPDSYKGARVAVGTAPC